MQTIYIDILLCVNLVVNFLILSAAVFYTHEDITVGRLLLGSAVGAVFSLSVLLPPMPAAAGILVKLAAAAATVFSALGKRDLRRQIKFGAVFMIVTLFFGGACYALLYFTSSKSIVIQNGAVYFDISPVGMIVSSLVCYAAFRIFFYVSGRYKAQDEFCILTIENCGASIRTTAKIDTGNTLCEPFSQSPVIVIGRSTAKAITPEALQEYETVTTLRYREEVKGVRFVPFTSVGGRGILPCFRPMRVQINGKPCGEKVYIALCREDRIMGCFSALVPSEIIQQ